MQQQNKLRAGRLTVVEKPGRRRGLRSSLEATLVHPSAALFQALIEQTNELVSVLAEDGTILYASPSHHRLLGYDPGTLVGTNAFDLVHDDDLAAVRARYRLATSTTGQTASERYRVCHSDGSWRTLEAVGTNLLAEPTVAGIVVNARDVTDRVHAEAQVREQLEARVRERTAALVEANDALRAEIAERARIEESLRRSEERYRHLVEHINEVIFTLDPDGRITYVSPAIQHLTGGRTVDEVLGHSFADFIHPDDLPAVAASFERLLGGLAEPLEYRALGKDGQIYWLRSQSQVIMEDHRIVAVQGVLTDVTSRRRAEMEARQQRESLEHVQRLTTAGEMTAEIAHQINQPLTAIINFAGGLAARVREGALEPEIMGEVATRIGDEARRASEVIRGLRAFLRKGERVLRDADLNHVVRHVYGLLDEDFRRESVDVRLQLDPTLPLMRLDSILIEQVILNLLRNALDALTGWAGPRHVAIDTRLTGELVTVTVADSGVGLPLVGADRIFEAFYTTKPEGLGLGLSVSRSIVQASGGRLWAERRLEGGTTVGFALPLAAEVDGAQ